MKKPKTERDTIAYHLLATEAARTERGVGAKGMTPARAAKIYLEAAKLWHRAARRSSRVFAVYAENRYSFCKGALIRLGRHDFVESLDFHTKNG